MRIADLGLRIWDIGCGIEEFRDSMLDNDLPITANYWILATDYWLLDPLILKRLTAANRKAPKSSCQKLSKIAVFRQ